MQRERAASLASSPKPVGATAGYEEASFGPWVRRLRQGLDLTQEALAEQVGCATQTLRSFENGRRRPSRELAARLAAILHVPASEQERFIRMARALPPTPNEDGAEECLSPPASAAVGASSLDPLIGRHDELAQLRALLVAERRRLVTLVGPGGVGKTRLALQAATDLGSAFAGGATVVPLPPSLRPSGARWPGARSPWLRSWRSSPGARFCCSSTTSSTSLLRSTASRAAACSTPC